MLVLKDCGINSGVLVDMHSACRDQVLYTLTPTRNVNVVLAPVGGRGDDAASTLNPVAGRGLTHLVRLGCALHQVRLVGRSDVATHIAACGQPQAGRLTEPGCSCLPQTLVAVWARALSCSGLANGSYQMTCASDAACIMLSGVLRPRHGSQLPAHPGHHALGGSNG